MGYSFVFWRLGILSDAPEPSMVIFVIKLQDEKSRKFSWRVAISDSGVQGMTQR